MFFPTEAADFAISVGGKSFWTFLILPNDLHVNIFKNFLLGAMLFSLFIIYDTHMLMRRLSAEEYIFAAINLYLDILNLFLHILRILSRDRK